MATRSYSLKNSFVIGVSTFLSFVARRPLFALLPLGFAVIAAIHASLAPPLFKASAIVQLPPGVTKRLLVLPLIEDERGMLSVNITGPTATLKVGSTTAREATAILAHIIDTLESTPVVVDQKDMDSEHGRNASELASLNEQRAALLGTNSPDDAMELVAVLNRIIDLENRNRALNRQIDNRLILKSSDIMTDAYPRSKFEAALTGLLAGLVFATAFILLARE